MTPARFPVTRATELIRADGRPTTEFREQLRTIPVARNALAVASTWAQVGGLMVLAVVWRPWSWLAVVILMGRSFAQLLALMHEAAHRLLFPNKRVNDVVGRWLLGYPTFTSTDAYRRVHMAHHRDEFGPHEPDIALYANYPIPAASFRRKLVRDATGRTGLKLMRAFLAGVHSTDQRVRSTVWNILGVQVVLLAVAVAVGHWWLYPVCWLLPYLTSWRIINRLRSIAEHGGMQRSDDRRGSTHTVRQHLPARFMVVPYQLGYHLAHHVDSGIPFRRLPRLHAALVESGYIDDTIEYRSYPAIWKALRR